MTEREAWLTLALMPGVGPSRHLALVEHFGSASAVLAAGPDALAGAPGISRLGVGAVLAADRTLGSRVLAQADALGARTLLASDPEFPEMLRHIPDAPRMLFVQGDVSLLARPSVAVVGSRDHSAYGATACRMVAEAATRAGVVVVSGMARGLDAVAHGATLEAGGATIGVLGNGLGVIYPAANRALYEQVARDGALVSEFPPGERPTAGSFPRRNRIVSGLARVTIVVEAAIRSGALVTASCALEQGRDVMAVPGPITHATAQGVNALIRDGAEPLVEVTDFLRHFPEAGGTPPSPGTAQRSLPASIQGERRVVAEALLGGERPLDELAASAALPMPQVLAALSALELEGVVTRRPGAVFAMAGDDA